MWSAPFEGEHRSGRRGQPGRPSAGMSASMRGCTPDTRPAGPVYRPPPAAAREWDLMQYRPPTGSIPDAPGSYQFYDAEGRVLYVGKAKSLRHRLPNYWQDSAKLMPRTAQMVAQADHVEWVVVDSEVDALILEHSLIQAHLPRYNVRLKDDKSYPWLAVTLNEEWPRPAVVRGRKRKGVRYFGPYGNAGAIRSTLDLLVRSFPVRTCSDTKFTRHERLGRPCLLYDIDRCSGPCVGAVDHEAYDGYVTDLMRFLSGDTEPVLASLEAEMLAASDELQFERAARLRDRIAAVHKAAETQQMVSDRAEDFDVVGLAEDPLEASVQIFRVRRGPRGGAPGLRGREGRGPVRARVHGAGDRRRSTGPTAPRCRAGCWCPRSPTTARSSRAGCAPCAAARSTSPCPLRGAKRALQDTVTRSAGEDLARHRLRRAADHNARSKALTELQDALLAARGAAADRVLRHEPPAGHRLRRLHGRVRGRAGQAVGLPALQGQDRPRQRRLRRHGGGAHAPPHRAQGGSRRHRRAAGPGASPTGPTCWWSTAARASSGWPSGSCASSGSRARWSWRRWPSSSRRSTGPARPTRCGCAGVRTPSTCCSACGTRPTASPSPSTGSAGPSG